eukprot:6033493-Amphidinium_carterae.2
MSGLPIPYPRIIVSFVFGVCCAGPARGDARAGTGASKKMHHICEGECHGSIPDTLSSWFVLFPGIHRVAKEGPAGLLGHLCAEHSRERSCAGAEHQSGVHKPCL